MAEPSTRVWLRVSPGAGHSELVGRHGDGWKVRVNDAALDLLAKRLELPRRAVSIVSGHAARENVVRLEGIDRAESERRLEGTQA